MEDITMSESQTPQTPQSVHEHRHRVTLTFNRPITDEELKKLQQTTDALEALQADDEDHDHSHPTPPILV